ncbi:MAG TPA: MraY family glycosyltransferase [Chitinophagaceae bacterium]|jgi:UDP-N-acetylmuramyl pentapeptide phosphotransferase/UDP-N-acetylglucosamine-1-phosphate transferase|nr:MraY family glycosyltransferase [Chitinophagaceae bacterium]
MLDVILTGSVAFIITFLAIPVVLQIAEIKKLYDIPDQRKLHKRPIPSLGGIAIFAGFFLASLLSISAYSSPEFQYFFAAAFVIFFLGLKDDLVILTASKKFAGQLIATAILVHLGGIRLTSMHGLFGFQDVPEAFSLALSYLTIIVVMNSFNLIDGVDGLAGSLGIMTMVVFGIYFYMAEEPAYTLLAFALVGSLLAFLIFNHHPAKIFMGDSGSLMIGLINAILVIKFINLADSPTALVHVESAVAVGFAVLMVPLFDTLRVFGIRIFKGVSPFTPDRNHIHHLMIDKGMNPPSVTLYCLAINLFFLSTAFFLKGLGATSLFLILLGSAFCGLAVFYYRRSKSKELVVSKIPGAVLNGEYKQPSKLVPLTKESAIAEQN